MKVTLKEILTAAKREPCAPCSKPWCEDQQAKVTTLFGGQKALQVTQDTLRAALDLGLDLEWFLAKFWRRFDEDSRQELLISPKMAFLCAEYVDPKPKGKNAPPRGKEDTRTLACQSPEFAFWYALRIDKEVQITTWMAARQQMSPWGRWYESNLGQPDSMDLLAALAGPGSEMSEAEAEAMFQRIVSNDDG